MELEKRINELSSKLRNAGKDSIASYFENLLERILSPVNDSDKQDALKQIISSGKISDLANFDKEEDRLHDLVYEEAKKLNNSFKFDLG